MVAEWPITSALPSHHPQHLNIDLRHIKEAPPPPTHTSRQTTATLEGLLLFEAMHRSRTASFFLFFHPPLLTLNPQVLRGGARQAAHPLAATARGADGAGGGAAAPGAARIRVRTSRRLFAIAQRPAAFVAAPQTSHIILRNNQPDPLSSPRLPNASFPFEQAQQAQQQQLARRQVQHQQNHHQQLHLQTQYLHHQQLAAQQQAAAAAAQQAHWNRAAAADAHAAL